MTNPYQEQPENEAPPMSAPAAEETAEVDSAEYVEASADASVSESVEEGPSRPSGLLRIVRLVVAITAAVVFVAVGLLLLLSAQRSSRNAPIAVDYYPGATLVSESAEEGRDSRGYVTADTLQAVFTFYASRYGQLPYRSVNPEGVDADRGCRKIYADEQPNEALGRWFARCIVDNSEGDTTQILRITMNHQSADSTTFILYEREWGN